jgi:hypothetical protein
MAYVILGVLEGALCGDCAEPASQGTVRIYRAAQRSPHEVLVHAVARPKQTYGLLTAKEIDAKQGRLLVEAETDARGHFRAVIGDQQGYDGESPLEVDLHFARNADGQPMQLAITTFQPEWRDTELGVAAKFQHVISQRIWCRILQLLGIWVICGRVTHCETRRPIRGVRVRALDVDWIQDDPLGDAITDAQGRFRIYYGRSMFRRTPFLGLSAEISGPDVYFRIEALDGTVLLAERPRRGRDPDRENVGHCFCAELCLPHDPPEPPAPHAEPQFTHVGQYEIPQGSALNDFTADGHANHGGTALAFTGTLELRGTLPDGGAPPREYRFLVAEYDPATGASGPLRVVDAAMIAPTHLGNLQRYELDAGGNLVLRAYPYWLNDSSKPLNAVVKAGGWIEVPTANDLGNPATFTPGTGRFNHGDALMRLDTTRFLLEEFDLVAPPPAHAAGDALPAGRKSRVHTFRLIFEERSVGVPASVRQDELARIVISNVRYRQLRHPSWAVQDLALPAVVMLDIRELQGPGNGCSRIGNELHALYTVYHPHLASATISFEGNGTLPAPHVPAISADGQAASGSGGHLFDTSGLQPCAYILHLVATLHLTDGYDMASPIYDHLAFCVAPRP